jgi:hypothetical protein
MAAKVLPLAITMMAGPQIISSIVFVTNERGAVKVSLSYICAVALASSAGVLLAMLLANALGDAVDLGGDSGQSTLGKVIEIGLVSLLIVNAVRIYLNRATSEPPKWLGTLQTAGARRAFLIGVALIFLMPGDIVVILTTGVHLVSNGLSFTGALPLIGLTTLIAALPLLFYLLFRRQAASLMPRVRDWMNGNSWVINIVVCLVFIALILS